MRIREDDGFRLYGQIVEIFTYLSFRDGFLFAGSSTRTPGEKSRSAVSSSRVLALRSRVYNRPHTTCYSVRIYICTCIYTGCACHRFYGEPFDLSSAKIPCEFLRSSRLADECEPVSRVFVIFIFNFAMSADGISSHSRLLQISGSGKN